MRNGFKSNVFFYRKWWTKQSKTFSFVFYNFKAFSKQFSDKTGAEHRGEAEDYGDSTLEMEMVRERQEQENRRRSRCKVTYVVVAVSGDVAIAPVRHLFWMVMRQVVPDWLALSILVPCTLNLVPAGANTPLKIGWKSSLRLTSIKQNPANRQSKRQRIVNKFQRQQTQSR